MTVMIGPQIPKLAVWLGTILGALCNVDEVAYGYQKLVEACEQHLSPEDAAAVIPYVRVVLDEFEKRKKKEVKAA